MSLRNVIIEWLGWGMSADNLELEVADQREFCADVMQSDKSWLTDALAEWLTRKPGDAANLIEAFRCADALQVGAILDRGLREYLLKHCYDFWVSEFTQVEQQESFYRGDE